MNRITLAKLHDERTIPGFFKKKKFLLNSKILSFIKNVFQRMYLIFIIYLYIIIVDLLPAAKELSPAAAFSKLFVPTNCVEGMN